MNRKKTKPSLRILVKWLGILLIVCAYLLSSGLLTLLPLSSRARRSARIRTTSFFSSVALMLFGVHTRVKHRERLHKTGRGRLIISNHVSYVDVLILSALLPSVFITSRELKTTPLLGMLATLGGSLFVDRRRPVGLKGEIEIIAHVLGQGFSVVLFPEGTTSNGDRVHTFKKSLFDSAVTTGTDILPLCLRYRKINDGPLTAGNRDALFYYGGVSFTKHFPGFLALKSVEVDVSPLNVLRVDGLSSRKELATAAHELITRAYCA
jgi:1-acyl-sn-glycerol-3-phosphate acyltransferase